MEMTLQRLSSNSECVQGSLSIDGASECVTLEKPILFDGLENTADKTCIPAGRYPVLKLYSPKFARMMPHIEDVPGRTYIMIHWGNRAADTDGCILVGMVKLSEIMVGESRDAFAELEEKLESAWANEEEVWIDIKNVAFVI